MHLNGFFSNLSVRVVAGIRTALMESPEHKCPSCETPGQSPDVLIPNKYLRAMVTSFVNETSYVSTKKPPVSATSSSSSAATYPVAPASAERTVVIKSEPKATDSSCQPTKLPAHLAHLVQVKPEPVSTELVSSRQSQYPSAGTQLNPMSMPDGQQSAVRTTAGGHYGYQPSRSMGHGTAAVHQASPSQIPSQYLQPPPLPVSGSNVGQSHSAPSLISDKQLE